MDSTSEYANVDITFCIARCNRTDCRRHKSHMTDMKRHYTVSDLRGSSDCLETTEEHLAILEKGMKK